MLISTVSPHIGNSAAIIQQSISRCWDRRCTCNKKRTRQLLQEDYESVNTGSEFEMDVRYSQFLTTLFMIFMYSSGIPILYPIAFIFFFLTYWFDKMFCKINIFTHNISAIMAQKATFLHIAFVKQDQDDNEVLSDSSLLPRALYVHKLFNSYTIEDSEPHL